MTNLSVILVLYVSGNTNYNLQQKENEIRQRFSEQEDSGTSSPKPPTIQKSFTKTSQQTINDALETTSSQETTQNEANFEEFINDSEFTSEKILNISCKTQRSVLFDDLVKNIEQETPTDITLMAEGKVIKAHRLILSAYSSYIKVSYETS